MDRSWGAELASCLNAAPARLRIICPFIKGDALWALVGDAIPADTRVITRFDLQGFAGGVSDIWALENVLEVGGEVRGVRGLHSKVFIFGDAAAAVTSANLTHKGLNQNAEFGCISELPEFVRACQSYFDALWQRGGPSVTTERLSEWHEQVIKYQLAAGRPGTRRELSDYGVNTGGASDDGPALDEAPDATGASRPAWVTEALHGHVKFFGQGHDRVPWSLPVLDEIDGSGSNWACTYPKNRRPRRVADGDVMYLGRMVERPDDYLIYGRGAAMAYVDRRDDASPADIDLRPWKREYPHYIRVHDAEFIAGPLSNGVPLSALMDALGADSFVSTQDNARRGSGNVVPRMALRQQPAVRLTAEGLAWLNDRFEAALLQRGRVPAEDLRELEWPEAG